LYSYGAQIFSIFVDKDRQRFDVSEYRDEVADLIEKSVQNEDHNIWFRIKEKTELKDRFLETVESKGELAM
jgi:hypothetical protein